MLLAQSIDNALAVNGRVFASRLEQRRKTFLSQASRLHDLVPTLVIWVDNCLTTAAVHATVTWLISIAQIL